MKNFILLVIFCMSFVLSVFAQERIVTGIVTDNMGPLIGAAVIEKGTTNNGTITDSDGKFSLKLKTSKGVLVVSYVGYQTREVDVKKSKNIEIFMEQESVGLDEVVVVGYGQKKKLTNTGAVSAVKGEIVREIPTPNVQNTLSGRIPGLFSQQVSGQPGKDAATLYIRGRSSMGTDNSPLVIVDDVEISVDQLSQIEANEIESISVLKDASTTAAFGIKGANGVIVITTKRGHSGKARINASVEFGIQRAIVLPKFLDAATTAELWNEARVNDGLEPTFTAEDIRLFRTGEDPYLHPNVDWVNTLVNRTAPQQRYTFDAQGGNEYVKYFVSFGYYNQDGILKNFTPKDADYNNNYSYKRTDFRSNLDITPYKGLKIRLDFSGRMQTRNHPSGNAWMQGDNERGLFSEIYRFGALSPFAYPIKNPDGSYPNQLSYNGWSNPETSVGNGEDQSIIGWLTEMGYMRYFFTDMSIVGAIEHQLDFITKGLSAKLMVTYSSSASDRRNVNRSYFPSYTYSKVDGVETYTPKNESQTVLPLHNAPMVRSDGFSKIINMQASLNYDRIFSSTHHLYGMFLLNQRSVSNKGDVQSNYIPVNFRGLTTRIGYDYKNKYLIEGTVAYNGTDRFSKNNRYGVFPAASIGWNIAEEAFWKDNIKVIDYFKLRASLGVVGSDVVAGNTYMFDQIYALANANNSYNFGETPVGTQLMREGTLSNYNVTWEKERKLDIGLDMRVFDGRLDMALDYFNNYRYDQLVDMAGLSSILGQSTPKFNYGAVRNKGFDAEVTWNDNIDRVAYTIGGTFSYARNKVIRTSEAPDYPWLAQTGRSIGTPKGYVCEGFYNSWEDIAESPKNMLDNVQPGDLKFKDLNGDDVIDGNDMTFLDDYGYKPTIPTINVGMNLGISWKGLTLSAMFQGAFGYTMTFSGESFNAFHGNLQPIHLRRWTEETADIAEYPRLSSTKYNSGVNSGWATPSTFYMTDGGYIRLKTINLSYDLPKSWTRKIYLNNVKLYVSGYNVYTWNLFKKFQTDGEMTGSQYPNMATYNFGIQIGI